jgi:P27 family predicted phage terminase small subunit
LKQLEGNPGKRKLPKSENATVPSDPPTCPTWLAPEAKREWRRVVREVPTLGKKERSLLAGYCSAYSRWREAEENLNKHGLTQEARHGVAARPEVKIAEAALMEMKAFAVELGLTPKSPAGKGSAAPVKKDPLLEALQTKNRLN